VDTPRGAEAGEQEADIAIVRMERSGSAPFALAASCSGVLMSSAYGCLSLLSWEGSAETPRRSCVIARSKVKTLAARYAGAVEL